MRPDERFAALLSALAVSRPVFHSEADFQLALGSLVERVWAESRVRLETKPAAGRHLDMLVMGPEGGALAVELKYLTAVWDGSHDGERYTLFHQGAQDIRAYDCVKDIRRVEQFVASGYSAEGLVVVLSNDPAYWRTPGHGRETNASAFRLYEGTVLEGIRAWGPATGAGTMKARTDAIGLAGRYRCEWHDYSRVEGANGRFRFLMFAVEPRTGLALS